MKKIHMIANTHFDPVWLWKWDEAMSSITATFRSALQRMEEYPEFKYSFTTPPVFEWIKNTDPQLFNEIKKRVAEGRWELAEGWWVQPDCFTPSGESLVRQGLYGQRYLKENFGKYSESVFNIDSFGHPASLPQILSKSGIKYYTFCRPEGKYVTLDSPCFIWKAKDGSAVLTYRDDKPYMGSVEMRIDRASTLAHNVMLVYGVTDHGGAPTIEAIEAIRKREHAVFSTLKTFFEECKTTHTVEGEFITGDFGVFANHPEIKSLNRIAENALLNAEKASVIANNYDTKTLKKCWHDVLFNQFHDILGGACIKNAYFDARNIYGRAIATANEIMHYNLLAVTNQIRLPGINPDNPWNVVVWNLNAEKYVGYIEAEVQWLHEFPAYKNGIALEDAYGNVYACQIIRELSVIPGFRSRFLFNAEIPAMGYKAFKVIKNDKAAERKAQEDLHRIETARYVFTLSENGAVKSICRKGDEALIAENLLYPAAFRDDGDTWAFNIDNCTEQYEPFKLEKIESVEKGAYRSTLKLTYSFRKSNLVLYYTFYENENYMDVRYRVNWNEKHSMLKLMSDTSIYAHTVESSYSSVSRGETSADIPMGAWLETANLIFTFKNMFSYNLTDGRFGFTVLRSAIYGDLRLSELNMDEDYDILSQGITEGELRILFVKDRSAVSLSSMFNNPPIVLCESNHTGTLEAENSFLHCDCSGVTLTVMKRSEDDNCTVLRGFETTGEHKSAVITLNGKEYTFSVAPYEIFTLKEETGKLVKVNMLEEHF